MRTLLSKVSRESWFILCGLLGIAVFIGSLKGFSAVIGLSVILFGFGSFVLLIVGIMQKANCLICWTEYSSRIGSCSRHKNVQIVHEYVQEKRDR